MTGAWKTEDGGQTWTRKAQMTHATGISIDPQNPDHVFVSGLYTLDGSWGQGGQISSSDGGETWSKNMSPPLQSNARSAIVDPNDNSKVLYTYLGGEILKGPNPARFPSSVKLAPAGN